MNCKRLVGLTLALFCLTSCASMLERESTYTVAHVENPPAGADAAYRVETYAALRSALQNYIEEGMDTGSLRFPTTYPGNLTVDLEKAKRQLMEEDPLGCYALSDVTFHVNRIIAYYEVTATFDYRVSPAEYRSMETVREGSALADKLESELDDLGGGFTVLLDLPADGTETETLVAEALDAAYDRCLEAVSRPELEIVLYPEHAQRAVAEIKLTYPESVTVLRLRRRNMCQAAERLAGELAGVEEDALYAEVLARWQLDPEGGSGADAALLDGSANQEGLDRGFALVQRYWTALTEEQGGETP